MPPKRIAHPQTDASGYSQALVEALPLLVYLKDAQGRWQMVNPYGEQLFALRGVDWQGKTDAELAQLHPPMADYLRAEAEGDARAWELGARLDLCQQITDAQGRQRFFEIDKIPQFDQAKQRQALMVVGVDMSASRQTELELQSLSRYNRSLIEASLDALATISCTGRISDVNVAMERITGLTRYDLINTEIFAYTSEPERAREGLRLLLQQGRLQDFALEIQHAAGRVTPVEFNATVFHDASGVAAGAFVAARDMTERKLAAEQVYHLAYYDALTDLPNRLLFRDRLHQALAQANRNQRLVALMFIDLDRFKLINDSLGHDVGDLLLKEAARRLSKCVRNSDTVARMGGDEFTIILADLKRGHDAAVVARKILTAFSKVFRLSGHEIFATPSIGIALSSDAQDPDVLAKYADTAMYGAKEQGRATYQYYTADMNIMSLERLAMENALRRALDAHEMSVHYQPQVDLASGRVIGMEALLRWNSVELGAISPVNFIPLAEDTGLIVSIGEWVLRQACIQGRLWADAGHAPMRLAVNMSARQFKQQDFVAVVSRILRETGLDPKQLELELTESLVIQNEQPTLNKLHELRAMGVSIAIDDFGTGYSSLSYLRHFPVDRLKIDRSFVAGITSGRSDQAIARAIIAMAGNLALDVVAEGVETQGQATFLRNNACNQMQGFLFSQPLAAEAAGHFLRRGLTP